MLYNVMLYNMIACCCYSPSETYGRRWVTQILNYLQKLPVPLHAAGIIGTLNLCDFSLYNSGIQSTTVSLWDLKDAILFLHYVFNFHCHNVKLSDLHLV